MQTSTSRLGSTVLSAFVAGATMSFAGTEFTYQGRLNDGANPANGIYELRFTIYDSSGGAGIVAGPLTNSPVAVSNGLFTVTLDPGAGVFTGADRWLEIAVRTNGGGAFNALSPRQPLTATPYAVHAAGANAAGLVGVLPPWALSGGYVNAVQFFDPGNLFVGTFHGDGGGLSNVNALELSGKAATDFWQLAGNAGTIAGTHFVGTTDNQSLELRVNGARAQLLEPRLPTANLIGGGAANSSGPGVAGAVIGGGGRPGAGNVVSGDFATIGGGYANSAAGDSVVAGGVSNLATGVRAVVAGGALNLATNGLAVVSGGGWNVASGYASVVAGGGGVDPISGNSLTNRAEGAWSAVGGGRENRAAGESATISGGELNEANGKQATVGGGVGNQSRGEFDTIGGGAFNATDFPASTVSGGQENAALNLHATVGGGVGNYATGDKATIGGGANNLSSGTHTTVPGGQQANPMQYGQLAHASGMFMNPGDAQHSIFVLRAMTDVAAPIADLALDGGSTRLVAFPGRSMTFEILVVARAEPPLTDTAGYHFRGVLKDAGGVAAFVGIPTATVLGSDVPQWSATLGLAGNALMIRVDGGGGAGYPATVRWTARVDAAEVAW